MGLVDLPIELLESIIDYIIPKTWKYYSEGRLVLNLRLLCSKLLKALFFTAEFFRLSSESFDRIVLRCAFRKLDVDAKNGKGTTVYPRILHCV
jgi:hypothetical protein